MKKDCWHKEKFKINNEIEKIPVPIISDAAMASGDIADGKLITLVIIDTTSRPDIEDLIKAHGSLGPGDANSSWGRLSKNKNLLNLILEFKKPSSCVLILEFDIVKKGIIIDQIVTTKGLYIQYGREGDRLSSTVDHPRIFIEITSPGFREGWDRIFQKALEKDGKKNKKLSRSEAKEYSKNVIKKLREFGKMRMKN